MKLLFYGQLVNHSDVSLIDDIFCLLMYSQRELCEARIEIGCVLTS